MRCIILLALLSLIGLAYAYPNTQENLSNLEADALLAVDAGDAHENESDRLARGWGGGGWGGGWGGRGGGWGGRGGGWGGRGGGWGRGGWGGGWG